MGGALAFLETPTGPPDPESQKTPKSDNNIIKGRKKNNTILFKIIPRMKFLFSNCLGDYSYSFQGCTE